LQGEGMSSRAPALGLLQLWPLIRVCVDCVSECYACINSSHTW
jgi:hypothetical protein